MRARTMLVALATATLVCSCSLREGGGESATASVTVKGSDTMVHLVSAWAEAFMERNPEAKVSVTGGGSGTGIAALINGTTDIAAASRAMKPEERRLAAERGRDPVEFVVARDGIAVVVNPRNPVSALSLDEIAAIFTGEYTDWGRVGGPQHPIEVLSRESSSGTYVFFQEHVLRKKDYTPKAKLLPATSAIIQAVSADEWAIGYVGLGYALGASGKVKVISVVPGEGASPVAPSEETVKSGEYPIARSLYLYTAGPPSGAVKEFVEFALSTAGQRIVRETGYVGVD